MAGKVKTLLSLCFLLSLVSLVKPQGLTFEEITTNDCNVTQGLPENLSCSTSLARLGDECLNSSQLCNGISECTFGEDEGNPNSLNDLECNFQGKEWDTSKYTSYYKLFVMQIQMQAFLPVMTVVQSLSPWSYYVMVSMTVTMCPVLMRARPSATVGYS